jgi:hypothetical protein
VRAGTRTKRATGPRLGVQEAAEGEAEQVERRQDLAEQLVHARRAERAQAPAREEQRERHRVRLHAVGLRGPRPIRSRTHAVGLQGPRPLRSRLHAVGLRGSLHVTLARCWPCGASADTEQGPSQQGRKVVRVKHALAAT